jgi:hypothetical protein
MNAGKAITDMTMDETIITFPAFVWLSAEYGIKIASYIQPALQNDPE